MKKALKATIGSIVLVAGLQSQAHANRLYDLNGNPPASKIVNTGASPEQVGFSFSLPSGTTPPYSATFDKIGFWVNTAANPARRRATISLYDITATGIPPGAPLLNQTIGTGATPCLMEGQFCFTTIPTQTLDSNKVYLLTSSFSNVENDNTYYADDLAAPSQVRFLDNITFLDTWLGDPIFATSNHGAFGPNLGGVVISGGPTPVPAPLPLLGATAALAYSRRIKARIKISAS